MHRFLPIVALALCGCAPAATSGVAPQSERGVTRIENGNTSSEVEINTERSAINSRLAASVDAAWAQLPAVYQALGVEGAGVVNANERVFGRQALRIYRRLGEARLSTIVDCGGTYAGDADTYDVRLTVMTSLAPAPGGGTVVRSWVEATGRQQASSSTFARCSSKGTLEREISRRLAERTAQASTGG